MYKREGIQEKGYFLWEMLTGAPGALVKDMKKEII